MKPAPTGKIGLYQKPRGILADYKFTGKLFGFFPAADLFLLLLALVKCFHNQLLHESEAIEFHSFFLGEPTNFRMQVFVHEAA